MIIATANPNTLAQNGQPQMVCDPKVEGVAGFFNHILKEPGEGIKYIGFLTAQDNFISDTVVEQVEEIFERNKMINAVYSDNVILPSGVIQYFPAFNIDLIPRRYIINTPLFVRVGVDLTFNSELKHLLFYDAFRKLSIKNIMYHIPSPLIHTYQEPIDVSKELEVIHNAKLP